MAVSRDCRRSGSSPRLRGTRGNPRRGGLHGRFIPAPAGNTHCQSTAISPQPVHPRACGEHEALEDGLMARIGSSPRLRGTHQAGANAPEPRRFIPAPAGNTSQCRAAIAPTPVHPRACGEHVTMPGRDRTDAGSSPRLRGTHACARRATKERRFIPAPAGNTYRVVSVLSVLSVHPRACGEHVTMPGRDRTDAGSSPRLRGTRWTRQGAGDIRRFIPAPAGNTTSLAPVGRERTVHPRACGEHDRGIERSLQFRGSSPRLRGTHDDAHFCGIEVRFIPAPAGNTG